MGYPELSGWPYANITETDFAYGYDPVSKKDRSYAWNPLNSDSESEPPDVIVPNDRPTGQTGAWEEIKQDSDFIIIPFNSATNESEPYTLSWSGGRFTAVHNAGIDGLEYQVGYIVGDGTIERITPSRIFEDTDKTTVILDFGDTAPSGNFILHIVFPGSVATAGVSNDEYDESTWDAVTDEAPSKNAVRDKVVSMDALIAACKLITDLLNVSAATDLDAIRARVNELDAAVVLKDGWDASTGVFPGGGGAQAGWSYQVTVAGTVAGVAFSVNDRIIALADDASTTTYDGYWLKADYSDLVTSVCGKYGTVLLGIGDIDGMQAALDAKAAEDHDHSTGTQTFEAIEVGSIVIGTPLDETGTEIPIFERKIKNDADEEMVAYTKTMEMSDNANGSEDVIIREYIMVGGILGMIFSTKLYSAAPSGSEAPVAGCRVRSDGTGSGVWGVAQWVDYDGSAWAASY